MNEYNKILEDFFRIEQVWEYSLDAIKKACKHFWNPQESFKTIHIAGTNWKGSVSKMIFQVLKDSGKRVGVYTSPHLIDISERFETQDGLISEEDFISYAKQIIEYAWELSYFEKCVVLAFLFFKDQWCEYLVLETGLWGRLDATNIVTPILSIITSIGYDHMEYLGNTLEEISYEKAGIIKQWISCILYWKNVVIEGFAQSKDTEIIFPSNKDIRTNLQWEHQTQNANIAYEAWVFLWFWDTEIRAALMSVQHRGRLEFIRENILIDGAHNEQWLQMLQNFLAAEKDKWKNIVYCIAVKKWKTLDTILSIFSDSKNWCIVDSDNLLLESPDVLQKFISQRWYSAQIKTTHDIFSWATKNPKTLYTAFGSLYMLGEFYK